MKTIMVFIKFVLLLALIASISNAQQDKEISFGVRKTIFSKVLNENREILISVPADYQESQKRFPVVYMTDGSDDRLLAYTGLLRYFGYHFVRHYQLPGLIMVSIPNVDRIRDMSIKPWEGFQNTPGADSFLKFITDELIPFIEDHYRTTDYRILTGGSAAGGFVVYSLVSKPDSFDAYLAGSPALFADALILSKAKTLFQSRQSLEKFLYMSYYEEDFTVTTQNVPQLVKIIETYAPKDFRYKVKKDRGRAHVSETFFYDGLLALFQDWEPILSPEITPGSGIFPKGKPIQVELFSREAEIRYSLDGTEPTRESTLYTEPITISKTVTLQAKAFRGNLSESDAVTANFKCGPGKPSEKNLSGLKRGLHYKYFEKQWYRIPDTISDEPKKEGIVQTFNLNFREKEHGFFFQFDGYIHIQKEGQYRFYLLSGMLSKLFIGNQLIVTNKCWKSYNHIAYNAEEGSYTIYLEAGYYPIKVQYTNAWYQGHEFKVSYAGPGIEKQEIPASILFYRKFSCFIREKS